MRIPVYQVDAFTSEMFGGNPAAVCPLDAWLPDDVLQAIALENNLSETAFYVPEGDGYRLRWFTPAVEVDLCGHATLATSHVLFSRDFHKSDEIRFETRSGTLVVTRSDGLICMDFPEIELGDGQADAADIEAVIGQRPEQVLTAGFRRMAVLPSEGDVRGLEPDLRLLKKLGYGLAVTAPGDDCDCASRYFTPARGIDEDPVTGSAHCAIVPYWCERLGKEDIHARQVSARGGELFCRLEQGRVVLAGKAVDFLEGIITL